MHKNLFAFQLFLCNFIADNFRFFLALTVKDFKDYKVF